LRFDQPKHALVGDLNGDGVADFCLVMVGLNEFSSADLI
jgi:hypothetical protein